VVEVTAAALPACEDATMSVLSEPVSIDGPQGRSQAQKWGATAVAFIFSAMATVIFALLTYVLLPVIPFVAFACGTIAALGAILLAFNSVAIVRWWIVLARPRA
jgi:hypothetical protein